MISTAQERACGQRDLTIAVDDVERLAVMSLAGVVRQYCSCVCIRKALGKDIFVTCY
jgi:hypothetical protein